MRGIRCGQRRGPILLMAIAILILIVGWGIWRFREVRRSRRAIAEARAEMHAGQYDHAARRLLALSAGGPGSDEAAYLLGQCEQARGRAREAAAAWVRVPPGSPFESRAIHGLAEMQIQSGRLADAERLVEQALADPRIDAGALRLLLGMIYSLQGRIEDGQRLVESNWQRLDEAGQGASERAIQLARLHVTLRNEAASTESMRAYIERAARLAPDDDRVWLGRATLATRAGAFDEATRWLDACRVRRPDDPAIWRARLEWALASGRVDAARAAMARLPAAGSTGVQVDRLAAWFEARRGDAGAEQRALERLGDADPADRVTIDRLAARARERGDAGRAADLQRRAAEIERLQARFQELDRRNQPIRDAAELARIAEELGQSFEARAFLTVAVASDPDRADLRTSLDRLARSERRRGASVADSGRTLAQALAPKLEDPGH